MSRYSKRYPYYKAHNNWKKYIQTLTDAAIHVVSFQQPLKEAVDAVWPDWFTTHRSKWLPQGLFIIYPMRCKSRRLEKQNSTLINEMKKFYGGMLDLSYLEEKEMFIEGKGSLVFDVRNRKVYSLLSPRSTAEAQKIFIQEFNKHSLLPWKLVTWHSVDSKGAPIYHTDVMFTLFKKHAIISLETIKDPIEKANVISELTDSSKNLDSGYEIIDVSSEEVNSMCCNIFNLRNSKNEDVLSMSETAFNGYSKPHLEILQKNYKIITTNVSTLEKVGGGSCRCLLAECF